MKNDDLYALLGQFRSKCSDRKLYLIGYAAYRQEWGRLEEESRRVIQLCEQYSDGHASFDQVGEAARGIIHWDVEVARALENDCWTGFATDLTDPFAFATGALRFVSEEWQFWNGPDCGRGFNYPGKAERIAAENAVKWARNDVLADLIRCVVGNSSQQITMDSSCVANVLSLAREIHEGQMFGWMPVLGAALEEGGCPDEDMLNHCQSEKPHARGCWVVDLILGNY